MTEINVLLKLLEATAEDKVNYQDKVIHFQGYVFVFRDPYIEPRESYINVKFSGKITSAGFWRRVIKESMKNLDRIQSLEDLNLEDTKIDFLFGGSLKTLVPTLTFGGYESLFDVWMFVKTPEGYMFPATLYYGQSGTSVGGWRLDHAKEVLPPDFYSIINFSPFNFKPDELDPFIEALEHSLKMVPVADYYGIYQGDEGYCLMGVRDNRPYLMELGDSYDKRKIDRYIEAAQIWGTDGLY